MPGGGTSGAGNLNHARMISEIVTAIQVAEPEEIIEDFVGMLDHHLGRTRRFLGITPPATANLYLIRIVSTGLGLFEPVDFVEGVREVLNTFYGDDPRLAAIAVLEQRLKSESETGLRFSLTDDQRSSLDHALAEIGDISEGDLAVLMNRVSGEVPRAAEDERTITGVIRVLEGAATPPGQVPALITFLTVLADDRPKVSGPLQSWISVFTRSQNITLDAVPSAEEQPAKAATKQRSIRAVLSIWLEKPYSTNGYQLTRWLRGDDGLVSSKHEKALLCSKKNLRSEAEAMLADFHNILNSVDGDEIGVEFLLDSSVINLNVDRWRIGNTPDAPRVGDLFPVVIHSVYRLHQGFYHAAWKERSRQLMASPNGDAARWMRWTDLAPPSGDLVPDGRDHDALTAVLATCRPLCFLGLHGSDEMDEADDIIMRIHAAIQVGVPAMIWRRDRGDVTEIRTLIQELAKSGRLSELPNELIGLRLSAAGKEQHPGNHVSLIWDDYDERAALMAGLETPREAQGVANGSE